MHRGPRNRPFLAGLLRDAAVAVIAAAGFDQAADFIEGLMALTALRVVRKRAYRFSAS